MGNPSWMALGLTLAAGAGVASLLSAREAPAAPPVEPAAAGTLTPSVAIVAPDKAAVRLDSAGQGTVYLLIKNGAKPRELAFSLVLSKGNATVAPKVLPLEEASVKGQELTVSASGCPCRGAIVVHSTSPLDLPLHVPVTLTPMPGATSPSAWVVWLGALYAVGLGIAGLVTLNRTPEAWNKRAEAPRWEPGKSWLTNLAVVGAVFNGLFTLTVVTEELGSMSAAELVVTSALFVAIAGLAPAIFELGAVSRATDGNAGWFLAAAVFTLWAGGGQLALSFVLLDDARAAGLMAEVVCRLLQALVVALLVFVGCYAVWSFRGVKEGTPAAQVVDESVRAGATRWRLL